MEILTSIRELFAEKPTTAQEGIQRREAARTNDNKKLETLAAQQAIDGIDHPDDDAAKALHENR